MESRLLEARPASHRDYLPSNRHQDLFGGGKYKYVYIHRYGRQLFDLEADPGEWRNLSGQPGFEALQRELEEAILVRFDPDGLAAAGLESVCRRQVIREALLRNEVHWDYVPSFDATKQYVR